MYKKLFLITGFILFRLAAQAQSTILTAANTSPQEGDIYTTYFSDFMSPGAAGANQTWDFSGAVLRSQQLPFVHHFKTCSYSGIDSGICQYLGSSNLVDSLGLIYSGGAQFYFYGYTTSTGALAYTASTVGNNGLVYSDNEDLLRYPLAYGDIYLDSYQGIFGSSGGSKVKGADGVSVDSWGKLKTPVGTYTGVLRVKTISNELDSIKSGTTIRVDTIKKVSYNWYDGVHRMSLFSTIQQYVHTVGFASLVDSSSTYTQFNRSALGIEDGVSTSINWCITPNPVSSQAKLSIILHAAGANVQVSITDITGRVVSNIPARSVPAGASTIILPVSDLPAGVYTVGVSAGGVSSFKKMVVVQ